MKCPYRKIVTHVGERVEGVIILPPKDVEEFAECYEWECPFYKCADKCKKAIKDGDSE